MKSGDSTMDIKSKKKYIAIVNDVAFQNLQHFTEYITSEEHLGILEYQDFSLDINLLNKKMNEFIYTKDEVVLEIMKIFELVES